MKLLIQRVLEASVKVDDRITGAIGKGLLVFICGEDGDQPSDSAYLAKKLVNMRIFPDEAGKMNKSLLDHSGSVLVVSQFTLVARWKSGNRPGFSDAAPPELGERLYEAFIEDVRAHNVTVETGEFGGDMKVSLINDGPITIWMDSQNPR